MSKIIGIDLGTTNSCVAVIEGGEPVIIPNALGHHITPSVVRFLENGDIIVGEYANRSRLVDPHNTITGIKRFIGRRYNEVVDIAQTVPFNVFIGKNNLAMIKACGVEHSPQIISAMILGALKASAEDYLGQEVTQTVITVPAYFNNRQRQATKEAGKFAGLEVLRVINEPTAAALAYGLTRRKSDATIAVFDLGGGTFDISILEIGEGVTEAKAIDGDGFLGGDDFDNHLVAWMTEEFRLQHGIDVSKDPQAMQRIREAAIEAKCTLSQIPEVILNIPFLTMKSDAPISLEMTLTRSKFEEICDELFERLVKPCKRVLNNAGLKPEHIDKVILVGGATRMPRVSEIVKRVFGTEPSKSVNPEEAVALGAATQAGVLGHEIRDFLLLDITSSSIGVEIENGMYYKLIEKNTTIPTRKSEIFSTSLNNQSSAEIHILEGDGNLVIDNRSLGRFILDDIPPAPRTTPQIEITFDIDANGMLNVDAKDLGTGKASKITVKASTGLMDSDLQAGIPPVRFN